MIFLVISFFQDTGHTTLEIFGDVIRLFRSMKLET